MATRSRPVPETLKAANRLARLDPKAAIHVLHKLIEDYRGAPD
ncbi:hypothetical protein [Streptomyces phaeofaciens]|jgi:hypothetical protein